MDTRFNQNETKLGILVFAIAFQMLAYLNSFLDEHVQVFWNIRSKSIGLEDTNHLLTGNAGHLRNTVLITKEDANLRGVESLFGIHAHLFFDIGSRSLAPAGGSALVGAGTLGDTLSGSMHTTHAVVAKRNR